MQRRYIFSLLGFTLALFLGCDSALAPSGGNAESAPKANGKGPTQEIIPVSFSVLDCNVRLLSLAGRLHVVSHVRQDKSDLYQVQVHGNFQDLTATGPEGETLAGGGAGKVSGTFDALPQTLTDTLQATLQSDDSGDALQIAFYIQYDIGTDGEVVVIVYAPIAVCDPDATVITGATD